MSRRRKVLFGIAAGIVVVSLVGGTWLAATLFVSPEQQAADASPPPPQPVLATVAVGDLTDSRVLPAEVASAEVQDIPVLAQAGQTRTVVTKVIATAGSTVSPGSIVLETNGAPVFLMASSFPFYRDIGVGDTGPDVQALQDNLVRLSLLNGSDGVFGGQTAAAVSELYAGAGYTAPRRELDSASTAPSADTETLPADPTTSAQPAPTPATPVTQPFIPLSALLAAKQLPATIRTTPVEGTIVSDQTVIALGAQAVQVTATIPETLVSKISSGMTAQITMPDGTQVEGKTGSVATVSTDNNGTQTRVAIERADGAPIDPSLLGKPVSVQITLATVAKGASIVPLVALSKQASGDSVVLVKQEDGSFEQIPVKVIATVGGQVAIDGGDRIHPGDQVRVG